MKVSVVDVSVNQKKVQVEIPAREAQKELNKRYSKLAKEVRLKGFRPGKIPLKILKSYYGKTVESEVSNQFIQETFPKALQETQLKPLAEADVNEMSFDEDGSFTYEAMVEVCPPFQVEGYRGMEIPRSSREIAPRDVEAELERIREQHAKLNPLEPEKARPVREGDVVMVDLTARLEGSDIEEPPEEDRMVEVGKGAVHPDLDARLVGRSPGESFSVQLDYPEDAPNKEMAGRRMHVRVNLKEIREKVLPPLDDELAKSAASLGSLDELKEKIREELEQQAKAEASRQVREHIRSELLKKVKLDLSGKVVDKEVDRQLSQFLYQFQSQGIPIDAQRFNTPEIRAEQRPRAEEALSYRLILHRIADQESIALAPEEEEALYQEAAGLLRMDPETVRAQYGDSALVEELKDGRLQTKVLEMIESEAVFVESSTDNPETESRE